CLELLDKEGERPVSLVSTLSSDSSRDGHSLCSRRRWNEQLASNGMRNQWNGNTGSSKREASGESPYIPDCPVIADTMEPNPKLTYVDRVVMEIIETERMYVKDLRSIVEDYLAHIIDMSNLPIRPEQVCDLFGNIEDIYEFNSELLQSLDMCDSDPVAIAQCFVDKSEYFQIYTQYCTNYPNSVAALTDCMRNKTLAKFFRDRQASLKCSLPLGSYLLKPVQRILKYHLLLQEIAKHLDLHEEGYEVVQEAIDTMTGVAWYINDMKRKHEHAVRVQEIQSLLINWKGPDLTTYGELVLEGTFHVLRAKNTRTLFLFDRMLLITKKRGEHYVYKTHISCSTLMLLDTAKDPLLFSVLHFKHPKQPHTVQAKSVEEKRLWAQQIKRLILENHNTVVPQKAREATLDIPNSPGKYHYSPERLKRTELCQKEEFHLGRRNGRRSSEPGAVLVPRSSPPQSRSIFRTSVMKEQFSYQPCHLGEYLSNKEASFKLQHADSEGALLGERCPLQAASDVGTPASGLDEPPAEGQCAEDPSPRRGSQEQLSPADSDTKVGSSPSEGGMEDEPSSDPAEQKADQREEVETHRPEDKQDSCRQPSGGGPTWEQTQINGQGTVAPLGPVDPEEQTTEPQVTTHGSQSPESPSSTVQQLFSSSQSQDSSRETREEGEDESDSSGLPAEETSVLTDGGLPEEEEAVLSADESIPPAPALDQTGATAEAFISCVSGRSSLVSEDLAFSSPLVQNEGFESPSSSVEVETDVSASFTPEPQVTSVQLPPASGPEETTLFEGEGRSTLSKQDRLLIHKIRRYYEHAEHQDANFCIRRRESLSYIPAGLVRNLSRQLSKPQDQAVPAYRRGLSRNRPTSWSVFDLPGSSPVDPKTGSQSTTEEAFRPSADMLQVWNDMEVENQEVQHISEEVCDDSGRTIPDTGSGSLETRTSEEPPQDSENSPASKEESPQGSRSPERTHFSPAHLPKNVTFQKWTEEDQILEDVGRMKNKVFQLARQYSQRIKNNRPLVWQRSRGAANQQSFKNAPAVQERLSGGQEGKCDFIPIVFSLPVVSPGKPNLRLPIGPSNQPLILQESPSPVQSPRAASSPEQTLSPSHNMRSDSFLWPDVQELRTKYTS
uniref:Pleckstrin homology and RhoGEF domain containing G3 n=1 Tax=Tetraodon nigroviridis TaxID=99883 RepID=H3DJA9_TETNG